MDITYEKTYHALEGTHWWFRARQDMICRLISSFKRDVRILEIGSASGELLLLLKHKGFLHVEGIDISEEAIRASHAKGLSEVRVGDAAHIDAPENTFDIIIASDVLEHVSDDAKALASWRRALRPGGSIFLFVPAHPFLWTAHDEVNQHKRRYTKKNLMRKVVGEGFAVRRISYWNMLLLLPIAAIRVVLSVLPGRIHPRASQLRALPKLVNTLLTRLVMMENSVIAHGGSLPFGVSLFLELKK